MSETRKRGRPRNPEPAGTVTATLSPRVIERLEELAKLGTYGGPTPAQVAGYLIMREIDDLIRVRVLDRTGAPESR
jgi:hypothetical protein